ncbi:Hypothetical protein NTJ_03253 [Nesidiocoris tenuis]|uniref:DUF19 domain-containing protein n=1 Tax=Nesidiocoris tenuis TaxID=355587 RepID=A0ABN7ADU7_9HEMI|nr:Hypothetical protein NTJ_03253 [Nesidiocoris tenuis]
MWNVLTIFSFAALVFSGGVCANDDGENPHPVNCTVNAIYSCTYPHEMGKFHAVSTRAELESLCLNLHDYLRCVDDYTRKCLIGEERARFNRMFSGTSMIIHEICTHGPYQTEFLKHAVCMKNLNDEFDECGHVYYKKIENIENRMDRNVFICCSLREYLTCMNQLVRAKCGPVTANFSRGFNERVFHTILTTQCHSITEEVCLASSWARAVQPPSWITLLLSSFFLSSLLTLVPSS